MLEVQRRALSAARESLAVAEFRFRQGAVSYLDVLVARQQRQRALIDWIGARAARVQSVERLVDSGPAHHRIRDPYPMEDCSALGCSPPCTKCAHDGVALRRQSMSALAQPAHDFIHAAGHDAALWRMSRHKY